MAAPPRLPAVAGGVAGGIGRRAWDHAAVCGIGLALSLSLLNGLAIRRRIGTEKPRKRLTGCRGAESLRFGLLPSGTYLCAKNCTMNRTVAPFDALGRFRTPGARYPDDASAAEWVHIDDGRRFRSQYLRSGFRAEAIRKATAKFLDVHLMIVSPEKYVKRFAPKRAPIW